MCHFKPRSERIPKRICMIWCCPWFTACSLANEFWYTAVVARDAPWHFKSRFESCPCLDEFLVLIAVAKFLDELKLQLSDSFE